MISGRWFMTARPGAESIVHLAATLYTMRQMLDINTRQTIIQSVTDYCLLRGKDIKYQSADSSRSFRCKFG
ncbi:hypothetical protein E2C01_006159 [Portunus trituberculatus]|uniref:Uncharacterized protein n=1 Tax=Portunus trituberculatus TaxID=210409 RepID=A0A5B7CXE1_PORTR|nr:hypothetical protein [Portunus trituberculatus]